MMKNGMLLLTALLAFPAIDGVSASQTVLWREGINLIPYPQQAVLGGDGFVFESGLRILLDIESSEVDRFTAADLVNRLKSDWGVQALVGGAASTRSILLTRKDASKKVGAQGYEVRVTKDRITVRANGEDGLFYGTRTLLQLIQESGSGPVIRGMEISDWPDIPQRAVHYDTKHHQDKAEYVREFIRTLSDYKINLLIWEWEDKFAYRSHPEIGAPGAFSMEEMQAFTRYARQYHIQLVPLVQGLGHVSYILKWPQSAHLREVAASNWEFCPRKEGSYELLFDLWREAMEATPGSSFIHIGTDETYELGQGDACGCRARMGEVGSYGLLLDFVGRCARQLVSMGRRVISWGGEYRPNESIRPPKGLIVSEFSDDLETARLSRDAGFPAWVYDPNPGIEHLFLPYFYRKGEEGNQVKNCLEESYQTLTTAAASGLFDGMVCTSWDDSGLHNQIWMMRFVNAAGYSWNGKAPALDEFVDKYYANFYGPEALDLRELWMLLNQGAYYYMDTFERKVWHWGEIGKTHLPDLPRGDAVEYNPFWNREYKEIVERSRSQLSAMQRAINICRLNLERKVRHSYDFEIFATIAELTAHTARTYLALSEIENTIAEAHRQHFVSHPASYAALERGTQIIEANLNERDRVFNKLVAVWEKTRFQKGLSTPEKKFFHQQDRARHYANRKPDMTYLIHDEQRLGLEGYLESLHQYMVWYKRIHS
jgi:hexosaminidase